LEDLELLDDDEAEIPIYTNEGRRIPRRTPLFSRNRKPCGVMVALQKIHKFFEQHEPTMYYDSDDGYDDDQHITASVSLYPQAFLHKYGNVQAKGVPGPLHKALESLNQSVAKQIMLRASPDPYASDDDDHDDTEHPSGRYRQAIMGISSNIYGSITHRRSCASGRHDAQTGAITAAFAGSHAIGVAQRRTAKQKFDSCNEYLPHERVAIRMNNDNIPTDLRLEYVTKIDMNSLLETLRNGR
jgi:hypothetical protein